MNVARGSRSFILRWSRAFAMAAGLLALPALSAEPAAETLRLLQPTCLSSIESTPIQVWARTDHAGPEDYTLTLADENDAAHRVLFGTLSLERGANARTLWLDPRELAAFSLGETAVLTLEMAGRSASAEATVLAEPASSESTGWAITFSGRPAQVYTTRDAVVTLQVTNPKTVAKSARFKLKFLNAKGKKKTMAKVDVSLPPGVSDVAVTVPASVTATAKAKGCIRSRVVLLVGGNVKASENAPVDYDLAAEASASPATGAEPLTVSFSGSATGGRPPYAYAWDFGDGAGSSEQDPEHTFSQAGHYTWSLEVADAINGTVSVTGQVLVLPSRTHVLTVAVGTGASGTPGAGSYTHPEGDIVPYAYTPAGCYGSVAVTLDGVPVSASGTVTMDADHSLSVTAILNTYTITATAGAGGSVAPSGAATVSCGGSQAYTITPLPSFSIADVQVDGVSVGPAPSYAFLDVRADHTFSASFTAPNHTLGVTLGTGVSGTPAVTASYPQGTVVSYSYSALACYGQLAVTLDGIPVPASGTVTLDADHALAVSAALNTYTLTATAGPGGTISPLGTTVRDCGSSQAYTIAPAGGHFIQDVLLDGASVGAVGTYTFTDITADHTIAASFSQVPSRTLLVSLGAGTTGTPAATATYPQGTVISYAYALADTCHDGLIVRLDGSPVSASGTVTLDADHTLSITAVLKAYTLTASAGAGGSISPQGATTVSCGSSQTFTITPLPLFHIADVLVDGVSAGAVSSYTFTDVRADHTLSAAFAAIPTYTLGVTLGTGTTGSPASTGTYPQSTVVAYSYSTLTCYDHLSVTLDGFPVPASGTVTLDADHALVLSALPITYTLTVDLGAGTTGTPAASGVYPCGQNVNYAYSLLTGYKDLAVTLDGAAAPASGTVPMNGNHHLVATASPITFTITASVVGGNGTVSPSGAVTVPYGTDKAFTFTPGSGYVVADVLVDGASVGHPDSYTFVNVLADHTLQVSFVAQLTLACSADPTAGIAPLAVSFTATPSGGNGSAYAYAWAFGDGATSTLQNPSHTYAAAGVYAASVTVYDGLQTAQCNLAVTVTANHNPSVVNLQATPSTISQGQTSTLTFTLDDVDPGDAISWAATLTQTPATIGVLDVLSGGPVAPGTGVTLHYTMLEACPSGRATCTATVQITAADTHGGTSSESVAITLQ